MSITTLPNMAHSASQTFDRTVADMKDNVASATAAYSTVSEKAAKTATELTSFGQGTMEAFAQASQILAAEAQDLFRQVAETNQAAFTEGLNNLRAIASAKTVKQQLELQANFARTSVIWAISESSRFARASVDVAERVSTPIAARAYLAAEKFSAPTA